MIIRKISNYINSIVEITSSFGILFMASIIFFQVLLRIIFKSGLPWVEEISRYIIVWVVLLTGSNLILGDELIKVDFFDKCWPPRASRIRNFIYDIIFIIVLSILIVQGWLQAFGAIKIRLISINMSWFWVYLSIPVGAFFMLIQHIFLIFKRFDKNNYKIVSSERKE